MWSLINPHTVPVKQKLEMPIQATSILMEREKANYYVDLEMLLDHVNQSMQRGIVLLGLQISAQANHISSNCSCSLSLLLRLLLLLLLPHW